MFGDMRNPEGLPLTLPGEVDPVRALALSPEDATSFDVECLRWGF